MTHTTAMPSSLTTLDTIREAAERIKPVARVTPLIDVSEAAGRPLFLKAENLQPAGAFKIRGAYNMVAQLTPAQRAAGVITYSSGNHGQAMALRRPHARRPRRRRDAHHRAAGEDRRRPRARRGSDSRGHDLGRAPRAEPKPKPPRAA